MEMESKFANSSIRSSLDLNINQTLYCTVYLDNQNIHDYLNNIKFIYTFPKKNRLNI